MTPEEKLFRLVATLLDLPIERTASIEIRADEAGAWVDAEDGSNSRDYVDPDVGECRRFMVFDEDELLELWRGTAGASALRRLDATGDGETDVAAVLGREVLDEWRRRGLDGTRLYERERWEG